MLALILGDTGELAGERRRPGPPLMLGGLPLVERAVLAAQRAGVGRGVVIGVQDGRAAMTARLRARGVDVTFAEWGALQALDVSDGALIIGRRVLVEPHALVALRDASRTGDGQLVLVAGGDAGGPALAVVPPGACDVLVGAESSAEFTMRLAALEPRREMSLSPFFFRRLQSADDIAPAETDYIRHQNGRESFFTKKIRRFSVPLSRVLVRRGVGPNQVTVIGLLLGVAAAAAVSAGTYTASLAGALLYYASMIFDCSDGEVARLSFRDSVFGAWFETVVDYATYFLLLGGLVLGSQRRGGADLDLDAAIVALAGSFIVAAVAGYLRQRVSGNDPGQFDEASAAVLRTSTRFHRFARWGRQWIKRSTIAHLIVALALVNQLSILIYLWAFGAVVASVVIIGVVPFVVRQVRVAAPAVRA